MRALVVAACLFMLVFITPTPAARAASTITFPSAQTVTYGQQADGSFPECIEQARDEPDDTYTCKYRQTDGGGGEVHTPYFVPNAESAPQEWGGAVGCSSPNTNTCLDEGPGHDDNATYIYHNCVAACSIQSRYAITDCPVSNSGNMCSSTTQRVVLDVTAWAYALFIPGANDDPGFDISVYDSDGNLCVQKSYVLTSTYTNYTTAGASWDSVNCPLTPGLGDLQGLEVEVGHIADAASDISRVTAIGLTITIRHANWRLELVYDFSGLTHGISAMFDWSMAAYWVLPGSANPEDIAVQLYDYSTGTWNTRESVTSSGLPPTVPEYVYSDHTYPLQADEIDTSGVAMVRFLDYPQTSTHNTFSGSENRNVVALLDYAAITQTTTEGGGGSPNPLAADCSYDWLFQNVRCLDISSWNVNADVQRVCFALDAGEERCGPKYGAVVLPSGNPWYSIARTGHTLHMRGVYGNGADVKADFSVQTDDFPRIVLWIGLALIVGFPVYMAYRRWKRRKRRVYTRTG